MVQGEREKLTNGGEEVEIEETGKPVSDRDDGDGVLGEVEGFSSEPCGLVSGVLERHDEEARETEKGG